MSYSFHPAAESEYLEAIAFYESKTPGLGVSYMAEFERSIAKACDRPEIYRVDQVPDIRRISLRKFPFSILFRETPDGVQILAVAHHRRQPRYWLGRA